MFFVRGSPLIEVMVLVSAGRIYVTMSVAYIMLILGKQVASLMILSGIAREPHIDLIASLITTGFIESSHKV